MSTFAPKLFGTDGIRGIANSYPMIPEIALKLGKSLAIYLKQTTLSDHPKIIIGKDTRLSGYIFEQALSSGLTSLGADVLFVGPLPTPAIAFLTKSMRAQAGIVISASHNPFQDNGIKIFDKNGFKIPIKMETDLEDLILNSDFKNINSSSEDLGKAFRIDDATGRYIVFLKNSFPSGLTLDGLKIVLDCANGAAYKVGPAVFKELGADVIKIGVNPDGKNINHKCGSLEPGIIQSKVIEHNADIGISLDGDADRVIFCDEDGNLVDGDKILAICTDEMVNRGQLRNETLVSTIMSNMALEDYLNNKGINLYRTDVGDKYVVEAMRKLDVNIGGEKSGHLIFLDHTTTGDGLLASLQVLSILKSLNKPLSELSNVIDLYPQILKNVEVKEKIPLDKIDGLNELVDNCEKSLHKKGRINVRYSGTEPVARIMVEGENESFISSIAQDISLLIKDQIGI